MSHDPTVAVVDLLDGDSALGLTPGTNLFEGSVLPAVGGAPANSVFVLASSGPEPVRVMGQSREIRFPIVQITVRWMPQGTGRVKAKAIMDSLQGQSIASYMDLKLSGSEPFSLGQDQEGNYQWLISLLLTYEETA